MARMAGAMLRIPSIPKPDLETCMPEPIAIDVIADLSCPWSYIGKKRLDMTLEMLEIPAKVTFYPYLQAADLPPDGMPRKDWLARAYGSPSQIRDALAAINKEAQDTGITFDFDAIKTMPNTLNAHRLVRWARDAGRESEMVERLYALFFTEGQDIGDTEVLALAAEEAGVMHRFKARKMIESEVEMEEIWEDIKAARELGLKMVPAFIIANKYAILGVDNPVNMAKAIVAAHEEARAAE